MLFAVDNSDEEVNGVSECDDREPSSLIRSLKVLSGLFANTVFSQTKKHKRMIARFSLQINPDEGKLFANVQPDSSKPHRLTFLQGKLGSGYRRKRDFKGKLSCHLHLPLVR